MDTLKITGFNILMGFDLQLVNLTFKVNGSPKLKVGNIQTLSFSPYNLINIYCFNHQSGSELQELLPDYGDSRLHDYSI